MMKYFYFPLFLILPVSVALAGDAEYNANQKAYDAMGVSQAHALGFTGAGVTVAVVDNGTRPTHQEFNGQFSELQKDEYNIQDITDHGTPVSSLIAGKKDGTGMHGIAYDAKLVAFAVELDDGVDCPTCYQGYELAWNVLATDEFASVKIINNSLGNHFSISSSFLPNNSEINAARALVAKDKLIVASAGNETSLSPVIEPAGLPYFDATLKNNIISAIAYNPSYSSASPYFLADYSNLAQYAQDWSLAAPVGSLTAASHEGDASYGPFAGTSAAAPVISGAAAVVSSAFPYMGGKQLADVLFSTADKNYADFSNYMVQKGENKKQFLFFGTDDGYGKNWSDSEKLAIVQSELGGGYTCSSDGVVCADVSYADVFGQGVLNLGNAVKGPGYFDANRLSDTDFDGIQYLYSVDTKEFDSEWSNNIGQRKSSANETANVGLKKIGSGILTLSGNNTYLGDTVITDGTLRLSGSLSGKVNVLGGSFYVNGGRVSENAILNASEFVMNDGYVKELKNSAQADQSGGTIENVNNTGTFNLSGNGYILNSLENSGDFYLNGGVVNSTILNSNFLHLNGGVFNGSIQNTGTVYNNAILKNGEITGGTLVNSEQGTLYLSPTPETLINYGNIVLLPSANDPKKIQQMDLTDLNLVRGRFVLDINNLPNIEENKSYVIFTATNSLTVGGEFQQTNKLGQFISSQTVIDNSEKTVSLSLQYLPISSEANAPSLTHSERQTAKVIDRLFKNEGKNDFGGYYFFDESSLRKQINTLYNQVKPLQFSSLPLSGKLTRGVQTHIFERQRMKDPLRYEGRKNYYSPSSSRAPRGDVYQQYRPENAPRQQYRYYVPRKKDVYRNFRPNGRSGGQQYGFGVQHQAWGQMLYHQGTIAADAASNSPEAESTGFGAMFGWDFVYSSNFLWGLTGGYVQSSIEQDFDTTDVTDWRLGAYFSRQIDFVSIDGALMFGKQSYDRTRVTKLPLETFESTSSSGGTTIEAALNIGYDIQALPMQTGDWSLRPYIGLTVVKMEQDAYQEKGDTDVNLSVEKMTDTSVTVAPGLIAGFVTDGMGIFGFQPEYVFFDFRYDHLLSGGSPKTRAYFSADSLQTAFDSLDNEEKSAFSIGVGINGRLTDKTRLHLLFNNREGDKTSSQTISASIIHSF